MLVWNSYYEYMWSSQHELFCDSEKRSLFIQNILHLKNSNNFTFWFIRDLFKCTLHLDLPEKLVQIRKKIQLKQKTYISYLQSKCKLRVKKKMRLTKDQCQISFALALAHEFCNTCADLPSFKCKSNFACNEVIV